MVINTYDPLATIGEKRIFIIEINQLFYIKTIVRSDLLLLKCQEFSKYHEYIKLDDECSFERVGIITIEKYRVILNE
jgi:hypothetical protein